MSWRSNRQLSYLGVIFGAAFIVLAIIVVPKFFMTPTCSDGKQNGDEIGKDCGGSCITYCEIQVAPIVIKWTRSFETADNVYNIVAYLENHNLDAGARFNYEFKLYDESNVFISRIEGVGSISPNGVSTVFVPTVVTGNRIPKRTTFTIVGEPVWRKISAEAIANANVSVGSFEFTYPESDPKLVAIIENETLLPIGSFPVSVILYNSAGNAFAVSNTVIDGLSPQGQANAYFSWPKPFQESVARVEIIPIIDTVK